ncbi:hypothetical protein GCM10020331_021800 [Ectobacillus funiculus]
MMEHLFVYPLQQIPLVVLAIAAALSLHEFAHAYVAYKFGDPTAKQQGRLTLSPLAHLDIVGTIAIFPAWLWLGATGSCKSIFL